MPQDLRDLVIRLDQKVTDGFTVLNAKLDSMERRADGHESRIRSIEMDLADRAVLKARFFEMEDAVEANTSDIVEVKRTFAWGRNLVIASWVVFATIATIYFT